jgi:putative copper resistance protein D
MARLLDLFGFLSVLLHAMTLVAQTLTVGGVFFVLLVARPLRLAGDNSGRMALRSFRRLVIWAALSLALFQIILMGVNSVALMATAELSLGEVVGANFFRAGAVMIAASCVLALIAQAQFRRMWQWAFALAVIIIGASVMTSHAAARLTDRAPLAVATALHCAATAAWIGGLPYLLLAFSRCSDEEMRERVTRRFSRLAMASVSVLAAAGLTLSSFYIDAPDAIYGTAYGVMVSAKVLLFGALLLLGALNFLTVKRLGTIQTAGINRLRPLAEVEVGIGFTIILAAASLTSVPPATDLTVDRLNLAEISGRMAPRWPRLRSPGLEELSEPTRQILKRGAGSPPPQSLVLGGDATYPNTPADIAWSEYNHHWAGVMVLVAGLLQLAWWTGRARWARHWPLIFLALAAFIFLRADPENWPLGPNGFWESFDNSEVLQHRAFAALTIAFGLFEWAVRTGRIRSERAALVFPLVCALGGALLLAHSHSLGNVKEELLAELTHVPLALLAVAAGCARWLELRLPSGDRRIPSLVWPLCFVLIGLLLLFYRES